MQITSSGVRKVSRRAHRSRISGSGYGANRVNFNALYIVVMLGRGGGGTLNKTSIDVLFDPKLETERFPIFNLKFICKSKRLGYRKKNRKQENNRFVYNKFSFFYYHIAFNSY